MFSFVWKSTTIRLALILPPLLIAGCTSDDDRARSYYEHGLKLISEHDNIKAAIELRNAVRLNKTLIEAWRALADTDEANGDWRHALADLRAIVELAPNDVPAKAKLGKLLLLAGSPYEAISLANAGLGLDSGNAELHALKAASAFKLDNLTEAANEAHAALAIDPSNVDAAMVLATNLLEKGDSKGALALLQDPHLTQAKSFENNVGFQLLRAKLFEQTGDQKNTEAALRRLVDLNKDPGYRKLLVNFYVEQHRLDDAEKELRNSAMTHPSDSVAELDLVRFLYTVRKSAPAAQQELNKRIGAGGDVFPYQIALAELDFAEGRFADSKQVLERLIGASESPEHIRTAKTVLGQMYLGQKNLGSAENLASDVLHDDPHNVPALKLRASLNLERSHLDAAIADLNDALNSQPRSIDLMLLLAKSYERSGSIELADKEFADATKASHLSPKVGLEYATFLQRRGSLARAEDILSKLRKQWPNDASILSALGMVRLARQEWVGAQEVADAIRRIDGSPNGHADQILGVALIGLNRYDDAITAFQKAYDAAPSSAQAMDSLVRALLNANKRDQAIAFLKSMLAKYPNNANALVLMGSVQLSSGATVEARKNFIAAIEAQPKDIVGYRALADLYVSQKNYGEAIKIVQSGIKQRPDATSLLMTLAKTFEQSEDYESAISEYQAVLDKEPGNLIAANNLASLLMDHRSDGASLKKAQSLAAFLRKSEIPQFKDTLGWASYQQGDYRTAVSLTEEAAAALPDQAVIRYHLGMGYLATGRLSKASEQLRKALELAPDTRMTEQIRSALKRAGS